MISPFKQIGRPITAISRRQRRPRGDRQLTVSRVVPSLASVHLFSGPLSSPLQKWRESPCPSLMLITRNASQGSCSASFVLSDPGPHFYPLASALWVLCASGPKEPLAHCPSHALVQGTMCRELLSVLPVLEKPHPQWALDALSGKAPSLCCHPPASR